MAIAAVLFGAADGLSGTVGLTVRWSHDRRVDRQLDRRSDGIHRHVWNVHVERRCQLRRSTKVGQE